MRRMKVKNAMVFCLVLFSAVCIVGTGFAEDVKKGSKDKNKDKKVNIWTKDHTLDIETPEKPKDKELTPERPKDRERTDGRGRIDVIDLENKTIIIGDSERHLSDDVKYFKDNGDKAYESDFTRRKLVEWVLGPDKKIIRLYLIEHEEKN